MAPRGLITAILLPGPTGERTLLLPDQWRDAVVNGGITASTVITILYLDGTIEQAPATHVPRLNTLIEERGASPPRPQPPASGKISPVNLVAKRAKAPLAAPRPRTVMTSPAPVAPPQMPRRPKAPGPDLAKRFRDQLSALRTGFFPPRDPTTPSFTKRINGALADVRKRLTPQRAPNSQPIAARLRASMSGLQQRLAPPHSPTLARSAERTSGPPVSARTKPTPRRAPNGPSLAVKLRQSLTTLRSRLFPPRDTTQPRFADRLRQSTSALRERMFPPRDPSVPALAERLSQSLANAQKRMIPSRRSNPRPPAESLQGSVKRVRLRAFPHRDPKLPTRTQQLRQRLAALLAGFTPRRSPDAPRLTERLAQQASALRALLFPARDPARPSIQENLKASLKNWSVGMAPKPRALRERPPGVGPAMPVRARAPKAHGPPLLIGWRTKRIARPTVEQRPQKISPALMWAAAAIVMAMVGGRIALALIPKVIPPPDHYFLTLSGSDALGEKLAPKLLAAWLTGKGGKDVSIVPLADSQGNLIDNERVVFAHLNGHSVQVLVKAHGTGAGFPDLKSGAADIAMTARPANSNEAKLLSRLGAPRSGKTEHLLATADVAVIVARANQVPILTKEQLRGIFSCAIKSWSGIPGVGSPLDAIHVYAPDDATDSVKTFRDKAMGGARLCAAKRFTNSEELEKAVADDPSAIGFVGLPAIVTTRPVAIGDGRAHAELPGGPGERSGAYPLSQRLFFYAAANPHNPAVLDFMAFASSPAGRKVLISAGAVPVPVHP